jgi:hypothetical protein
MKNKIIIGAMLLTLITIIWVGFVYAQNSTVPTAVADQQVADNKSVMDKDIAGIAADNNNIATLTADLVNRQQGMLAVATQSVPLQSAVAVCASNPALYCPGWTVPIDQINPISVLTTNVNWDAVALLKSQGVNWSDIKASQSGINWTAVYTSSNGFNWQNLDQMNVNWINWPNAEAAGVNWYQWLLNGGQ